MCEFKQRPGTWKQPRAVCVMCDVFSTTLYSNANRPANRFLLCCFGCVWAFRQSLRVSFRNKSYKCVFHHGKKKKKNNGAAILHNFHRNLFDAAIIESIKVLQPTNKTRFFCQFRCCLVENTRSYFQHIRAIENKHWFDTETPYLAVKINDLCVCFVCLSVCVSQLLNLAWNLNIYF